MDPDNSKNRKIIIVIAALAILAIALFVVIVIVNNNSGDRSDTVADASKDLTPSAQDISGSADTAQVTKSGENNNESNGKNDPKPTATQVPVEKTPVKVTLGNYKGIKATYSPVKITEEDIEKKLEQWQDEKAYYKQLADRPFESEDMAIVSVYAYVDKVKVEELSVFCLQDILGDRYLPDFIEDDIIGRKIGDVFEFDKEYTEEDGANEEFKGKNVHYVVELIDGFVLYIPELTDEFILEVSDGKYSSKEDCMTTMKADLQEEENEKAYTVMENDIKNILISNCSFEGDIEDEVKSAYILKLQENDDWAMDNYYMDGATYYELTEGYTLQEYQEMLMNEADMEIKCNYIFDAIVDKENLKEKFPEASVSGLRELAFKIVVDAAEIIEK